MGLQPGQIDFNKLPLGSYQDITPKPASNQGNLQPGQIDFNSLPESSYRDVSPIRPQNITPPPQEQFGSGIPGSNMPAQDFTNQPAFKQYAQAFVRTIPKDIYDFFVSQPVEFAKSVAEAIPTLATGGKYTPNFGGAVSESKQALQEGAQPFGIKAAVIPAVKTLAAGAATGAEAEALAKGIGATAGKVSGMAKNVVGKALTPDITAEEAVSKVTGANTPLQQATDLRSAKILGENIDSSKSTKDLINQIQTKVTKNTNAVDKALTIGEGASEKYTPNIIKKLTGTKTNPISSALGDLKNLYTSTRDESNLNKIKNLINTFNKDGLTPKQINDIARQYGSEFSADSFNKLGVPKTSISGETAENTRTAVKGVARSLMPDGETQKLDQEISDLLDTKNRLTKQSQSIETAKSNTKSVTPIRKMVGKTVNALGKATDVITGGAPKALLRGLQGMGEEGTSNAIEMEKQIQRNLSILKKLIPK